MLQRAISKFATTGFPMTEIPASLGTVQGIYNGAADCYLQIHDATTAPAEDAVPLWSQLVFKGVPFEFKFSPADLEIFKGNYVCFSSTAGTKTIATGVGNTGDIVALVSEYEAQMPAGAVAVGDLSTPVHALVVWEHDTASQSLLRCSVVNNAETTRYLMLFGNHTDTACVNKRPVRSWKMAAGATLNLNFGTHGIKVRQVMDGTLYNGCLFAMSNDEFILTLPTASDYILAYYV